MDRENCEHEFEPPGPNGYSECIHCQRGRLEEVYDD